MSATDGRRPWYAKGLRFACRRSGRCCSGAPGVVWFGPEELARMACFLGLPSHEFLERYARRVGGKWSLREVRRGRAHDCVFLERDDDGRARCAIHEARPTQCRTWPFWPENLASPQAYREAAALCPGMRAGLAGEGPLHDRAAIERHRRSTPEI